MPCLLLTQDNTQAKTSSAHARISRANSTRNVTMNLPRAGVFCQKAKQDKASSLTRALSFPLKRNFPISCAASIPAHKKCAMPVKHVSAKHRALLASKALDTIDTQHSNTNTEPLCPSRHCHFFSVGEGALLTRYFLIEVPPTRDSLTGGGGLA